MFSDIMNAAAIGLFVCVAEHRTRGKAETDKYHNFRICALLKIA